MFLLLKVFGVTSPPWVPSSSCRSGKRYMVFCRLDAVQSKAQHFEYYDPSFAAATTAAAVAAATTTTTAATITQACPVATVAGDATGYTQSSYHRSTTDSPKSDFTRSLCKHERRENLTYDTHQRRPGLESTAHTSYSTTTRRWRARYVRPSSCDILVHSPTYHRWCHRTHVYDSSIK